MFEIVCMLRPGGLVILIEPDTELMVDGKFASEIACAGPSSRMAGWLACSMGYLSTMSQVERY